MKKKYYKTSDAINAIECNKTSAPIENGSVTSRSFRKLRQTDLATDRHVGHREVILPIALWYLKI